MTISDREAELFDRWRGSSPGFVADGVVDEEAYVASTPKVLFILKEVNDADGGGWDLRDFIREGGRERTWDNATRWIHGIRNLDRDIAWSDIEVVSPEHRRSVLRSICAVNLKKSPGSHTSNLVLNC